MPFQNDLEEIESNALAAKQLVNANLEDLDRWRIFPADGSLAIPAPAPPGGALRIDADDADPGRIAHSDGADYIDVLRARVELLDATLFAVTFTLPPPSDPVQAGLPGVRWMFKRIDGSGFSCVVEVDNPGTEDIDGTTSRPMPAANRRLALTHNGVASWQILDEG